MAINLKSLGKSVLKGVDDIASVGGNMLDTDYIVI